MSDDVLDDALSRCLSRDSLETAVGRLLTAERCTFLSSFEGRHLSGPTLEMSRLKETGREEVREDETPEEGRMKVSQRGASASEPVSAAGSLALCEAPHFTGPQGPSAVHPQGNVPEGLTETASEGVEQAARGEGRAGEGRGEWIEKMEEAVRGDEEIEGGEGTAEALFGVVTVRRFCCRRATVYLDSSLQITSHLFSFFVIVSPFFLVLCYLLFFVDSSLQALQQKISFYIESPFPAYLAYVGASLLMRCFSQRSPRDFTIAVLPFVVFSLFLTAPWILRFYSTLMDLNVWTVPLMSMAALASHTTFGIFIPLLQFPCLFLCPLSLADRLFSLFGFCIILLWTSLLVFSFALFGTIMSRIIEEEAEPYSRTPTIGLFVASLVLLLVPATFFVRRSIPRRFTAEEIEEMRQEGSGFFFSEVSLEGSPVETQSSTLKDRGMQPDFGVAPRVGGDPTRAPGAPPMAGRREEGDAVLIHGEGGKEVQNINSNNRGAVLCSRFRSFFTRVKEPLNACADRLLGPPHHGRKQRLVLTVGILLLLFDFLTDVYVAGVMRGLSREIVCEGLKFPHNFECAARSTMSRRSDAVSPEKKRLAVFGTVVFGLAMLDLVNLWLLRRDIRGPVTPFVPARTPLVRLVALFLSLNELVIFALTVVVFSSFRGRALAVSIVSTLLGILWKLVQFLWVCAACKTRAA